MLLHDLLGPPNEERHIQRGEGLASHGCTGRISFNVTRTYGARLVTLLGSGVTRQVRTAAPEQRGGTLLSCMEEGVEMPLSLTP